MWGSETQATRQREGAVGHHMGLDRPTAETLNSPTVTPKLQRRAAQAAHDSNRLGNHRLYPEADALHARLLPGAGDSGVWPAAQFWRYPFASSR
jgi:hypothetical protein